MSRTASRESVDRPITKRRNHGAGELVTTAHACAAFRSRHAPGLSPSHARRELAVLARSARRTEQHTAHGEEIWEAEGGVRLVVRLDRGTRIVVTVLPVRGLDEEATP